MTLRSVEASDVELSVSAAVGALVRAAARGAGGSAVHALDFNEALLALALIPAGDASGLAEILGLSVKGPRTAQTVLVAGIWGCSTFSACGDGREDACAHSLLHVPVATGIVPESHAEADGTKTTSSAYPHAVLGDLARVKTARLACGETVPSRATNLALPHLRASATVAVLGVGGLGNLAVQVLRTSTASRIVAIDASAALRLADHDGSDAGAASYTRASHGFRQATRGLAVRSNFDLAGRLADAIVANYGVLVAAGRGTGSFLIDSGTAQASHGRTQ